jgi:hypothetical protein
MAMHHNVSDSTRCRSLCLVGRWYDTFFVPQKRRQEDEDGTSEAKENPDQDPALDDSDEAEDIGGDEEEAMTPQENELYQVRDEMVAPLVLSSGDGRMAASLVQSTVW